MLREIDDIRMSELLAPLARLESVALHEPGERRSRRLRPIFAVAVVAAALAVTGVAIAAGFGAFANISAAQHPQASADQLSPGTAAFVAREGCGTGHMSADGRFIPYTCDPGSSRLLSTLPNGDKLYVLEESGFAPLCILLEGAGLSICGGVDETHPVLQTASISSDSSILAGVAMDGVKSVSFKIGGKDVTVPVSDNAWAYEGPGEPTNVGGAPLITCVTAHLADGSSVPEDPSEACS
ncbi:MAG TPA: hypothetical protein VGH46_09470 [Gaiellaceae bacterium]